VSVGVPAQLLREGFAMLVTTGGPILLVLLLTGLVIGVLQAATQINDPSVGFLPRLAVTVLLAWLTGGWVVERLARYLAVAAERMGAAP
jgi:flagellar biosynthesis protein FliQ